MTVNGQWNRAVAPDLGAPDRYAIPEATLKQCGFKDMHQFRNWRWYKGLGGGPIVDLGSHQIDIYNWFLGAPPSGVMASGGLLYHDPKTHEWHDTVMVIYDYDTALGPAAYYQTQTTNGSQGYYESFMGDQGTLLISESELNYAGQLYRDPNAPAWDEWIQKGYVSAPKEQEAKEKTGSGAIADVRESVAPDQHTVPVSLRDPYHSRISRTSSTPFAARRRSTVRRRSATRAQSASSRSTRRSTRRAGCRSRATSSRFSGAGHGRDADVRPRADDRDHGAAGSGRVALPLRGLTKLTAPSWTAAGYLKQAKDRSPSRSGGSPRGPICSPMRT